MSGTTVTTAAEAAGVDCPAEKPGWTKDHDCDDCEHQQKCLSAVYGALGL